MSGLSNAQLAAQVSDLLTRWNAREDQVQDWLGGTATGGPEGDGRYPLSNARGDTNLIPCPAALAATASGPAAVALGHRDGAEAARDEALSEADRSEAQRVLAESAKAASIAARDLTLQYRDRAANAEANAEVHRQYAEAARVGTAADLEATADHRDDAEYASAQAYNHMVDAEAAAVAAGNFNPALYATRADGLSQIAGLQAALDARLLTSGFTWAALPGKPSTFTPSAHSHVIADVTGLQAALDGKQASGSYAAASHGHAIADVTGLQSALDAKVASGSAGSLSSLTVGAPGGTTGIIYLGQNQTAPAYLYWNGGAYAMPSGPLLVNGSQVWTAATFNPASKADLASPSFIGSATVTNSGSGYVYLNAGSATASGYIAFHKVDGTRRGYIGFGNDSTVEFAAENGALFRFNHRPVFNGQTPWDSGNFDPATKSGVGHGHAMSDITGLSAALTARDAAIDLKANKASPVFSGDVVIANGNNKVIFHQPNNDAFYLAPSNNAGTDWLWSQQLQYDRVNARWAFSGPLLVQGHAVWTAGNFDPASKLGVSAQAASAASAVTSGLLGSNTGAQNGSLQYWNTVGNTTLNPDSDWWYAIRMGHGDADTYYSGSLALAFFTDNLRFRRKVNGANQSWRSVWHDGNFDPATKASLTGAIFTGDAWNSAGGSFKVIEANGARANQVYLGADASGGYIHSTYGSGGTSAFRVICEGSQRLHVNTTRTFVENELRTPRVQYDTVRSGAVGIYDAAQTQAVWAMGPDYQLTAGGASNVIGNLYGLAWSYEPNYGGSGNNPQSKPELYHQLLLMQNGVTSFAAGVGIWTSGRIECAGNGGWTMGSYANKNRIDYDGSKFRFINSGNANASVEMSGLTTHGAVTHNSLVSFAQGSVTVGGDGAMHNSNWYRSTGQTGWFNASYSTGIWSITGGEVRTYNGSRFHSEGNLSSGGVVISASDGGFQNAGYVSGRNRIWSFANADAYGLSYYQGAGGWGGMDTINFHFGNTAEGSTLHKFRSDGVAAHVGDLYVKGYRLPVFTSSTGAPSGGVDGDIHITY